MIFIGYRNKRGGAPTGGILELLLFHTQIIFCLMGMCSTEEHETLVHYNLVLRILILFGFDCKKVTKCGI
jgi:hypothetical protein